MKEILYSVYPTTGWDTEPMDPVAETTNRTAAIQLAVDSLGSLMVHCSVWEEDKTFPLDLVMVDCYQVYP